MNITPQLIGGFFRHLLTGVGPILSYNGYTDEASWEMVSGAIMTMGGFIWSFYRKIQDKKDEG